MKTPALKLKTARQTETRKSDIFYKTGEQPIKTYSNNKCVRKIPKEKQNIDEIRGKINHNISTALTLKTYLNKEISQKSV